MLGFFLYTIHVVTSIFLILVVLLQQGKGADLSVFGGGSTMTAFGARGAASLLHKATVGGFVVFILTTLSIGLYQSSSRDDVISGLPSAEEAAATTTEEADEEEAPAGVLPEADEGSIGPAEAGATPEDSAAAEDASTQEGGAVESTEDSAGESGN